MTFQRLKLAGKTLYKVPIGTFDLSTSKRDLIFKMSFLGNAIVRYLDFTTYKFPMSCSTWFLMFQANFIFHICSRQGVVPRDLFRFEAYFRKSWNLKFDIPYNRGQAELILLGQVRTQCFLYFQYFFLHTKFDFSLKFREVHVFVLNAIFEWQSEKTIPIIY